MSGTLNDAMVKALPTDFQLGNVAIVSGKMDLQRFGSIHVEQLNDCTNFAQVKREGCKYIVELARRSCQPCRILVFAHTRKLAVELGDALQAAKMGEGAWVASATADTPRDQADKLVELFVSSDSLTGTRVLVGTSIFATGVNFPNVHHVVVVGSHCLSELAQMFNRCARNTGQVVGAETSVVLLQPTRLIQSMDELAVMNGRQTARDVLASELGFVSNSSNVERIVDVVSIDSIQRLCDTSGCFTLALENAFALTEEEMSSQVCRKCNAHCCLAAASIGEDEIGWTLSTPLEQQECEEFGDSTTSTTTTTAVAVVAAPSVDSPTKRVALTPTSVSPSTNKVASGGNRAQTATATTTRPGHLLPAVTPSLLAVPRRIPTSLSLSSSLPFVSQVSNKAAPLAAVSASSVTKKQSELEELIRKFQADVAGKSDLCLACGKVMVNKVCYPNNCGAVWRFIGGSKSCYYCGEQTHTGKDACSGNLECFPSKAVAKGRCFVCFREDCGNIGNSLKRDGLCQMFATHRNVLLACWYNPALKAKLIATLPLVAKFNRFVEFHKWATIGVCDFTGSLFKSNMERVYVFYAYKI